MSSFLSWASSTSSCDPKSSIVIPSMPGAPLLRFTAKKASRRTWGSQTRSKSAVSSAYLNKSMGLLHFLFALFFHRPHPVSSPGRIRGPARLSGLLFWPQNNGELFEFLLFRLSCYGPSPLASCLFIDVLSSDASLHPHRHRVLTATMASSENPWTVPKHCCSGLFGSPS